MAKETKNPDEKITRPTPSGGSVTMKQSDWDRFDANFQKSANVDSPSVYSSTGERIPSGAETQAARIATIGRNAEAISNWRQQEEIRKGQQGQTGGPVNRFGRPIESFWVKTDPETGMAPAPALKPMPQFGGQPDFVPTFPFESMGYASAPVRTKDSQEVGATGSISSGFLSPFDFASNKQSNLSTSGSYLSPAIKEREKQARSLGLGFEMSPYQQIVSGFNRNPTRNEASILGLRRGIQNLPALGSLTGGTVVPLSSSFAGSSQPSPISTGFGNIFPENPSMVFNRRPRRTDYYA